MYTTHLKHPRKKGTYKMAFFQKNNNDSSVNHPMIDLREVNKFYKTAVGDYHALDSVDLQINAGEFVSIIGKSGSGKTTLLNMIDRKSVV